MALAKEFGGEIINADSMQVYKNLNVGTAKPTAEERQGIPHHLLDFLTPETPYSVADFTAAAAPLITQLNAQNRLPLVVGGTGLYISSLLKGVAFETQNTAPALREQLRQEAETNGPAAMYAKLRELDPDYAAKVHPNNQVRVLRALEAIAVTGKKMSDQQQDALPAEAPYHALCLCLTCRDRNVLYRRIDLRVIELVQPVEQPAIGARVGGHHRAQLGVAVRQLAQRFSVGRRVLGSRRRVVEMQLFSHRNSRLHGHEVVTQYRDHGSQVKPSPYFSQHAALSLDKSSTSPHGR